MLSSCLHDERYVDSVTCYAFDALMGFMLHQHSRAAGCRSISNNRTLLVSYNHGNDDVIVRAFIDCIDQMTLEVDRADAADEYDTKLQCLSVIYLGLSGIHSSSIGYFRQGGFI
jgi:hypothetical protein